ncbi:uncharacterized protein [Rutidosis leptorrhynchoides]|uniref:uncharacterized protein n=1 Tax=Rutidosis leptorrhynchoides TaxID=125765 RepID=UPI003A99041B
MDDKCLLNKLDFCLHTAGKPYGKSYGLPVWAGKPFDLGVLWQAVFPYGRPYGKPYGLSWHILDGAIVWYKKKQKKLLLFKVDFEKAYDLVSWRFLDHMFSVLGFGDKWHRWVMMCLSSACESIFVNGSPTNEFPIERGLRR